MEHRGSYRVWFTFRNEYGERRRDYLDHNGKGLLPSEALYVARELKAQGKTWVRIARIGSEADKAEREEWQCQSLEQN